MKLPVERQGVGRDLVLGGGQHHAEARLVVVVEAHVLQVEKQFTKQHELNGFIRGAGLPDLHGLAAPHLARGRDGVPAG
eukprot:CAMPEP_0175469496 /NCGR_PEP_ID=MMETSP0095-20121207/72367_1 /TAXON_ID=311494 /ORGANISM="Alexandrium monilatum, Strain CCMP3105" /LENGTH=78 /DNA_ID=CAMNT_0016770905 /DNA_START=518 /DNA_END=750 /DNA_ORIENTATION=-